MGIIMSTTCFGGTCLDMDDLYNFIVDIKDLDLYGYTHQTCCETGEYAADGCSCLDSSEIAARRAEYCIFDYCLTWDELDTRIAWMFTEFDNDNLWFDLPVTLLASFAWAGSTSDLFPGRDATFWTRFGQISMIFTGAIAAYLSGTAAVEASISTTTFAAHSYASYSVGSVMAKFTGI